MTLMEHLRSLVTFVESTKEATEPTEATEATELTEPKEKTDAKVEVFSGCPWCSAKVASISNRCLRFDCGQEYIKDIGELNWRPSCTWVDICVSIRKSLSTRVKNTKFKFIVER